MKATAGAATTTTVSLLLTNLRLLDLPQIAEVPVTEETFSLGKNKSKAFELIVHHIFNCYDPAECKSRFAGSWPIYEPAQSKNFRAVVIAWLTDLKKTGALHNAVIIRKSMFDDCQGERYEELLLSLSTMALKKVVEKTYADNAGNTVAFQQAISSQPDMDVTNVLNLAYQVSLKRGLQRRFVEKQKWFLASRRLEEQEQLVSEKEDATALAQQSRRKLDVNEKNIKTLWEKNWVGDQSIYKLLLPEKSTESEQAMWSDASFQRLLKTGSLVNKDNSKANSAAILNDMEAALKFHQDRISKWSTYSEEFLRERQGPKKAVSAKKVSFAADVGGGLGIDFNKHQDLHANAFSLQEGTQLPVPSAEDAFGKLFNSMRKELQTIRVSRRKLGTLSYAATYGESEEEEEEQQELETRSEVEPVPEVDKSSSSKDMTEEEALSLLTSHLPTDPNPPKPAQPEPKVNLVDFRAALAASKASLAENPQEPTPQLEPPELSAEKQSPKPRLRSPPPPPTRIELDEENDDQLDDTITPESFSPEYPRVLDVSEVSKSMPTADESSSRVSPGDDEEDDDRDHPGHDNYADDSMDEYMVEKMVAQIAASADTPAPTRIQRVLPQATWSREELEEDPFKPRPKVALSPPLTPYRFQSDRGEQAETPRVGYSSSMYTEDDDDDYDDEESNASPSKGRGRSYR